MYRDSSNADCRPGPLAGSNPAEQTEKAYHQLFEFVCMYVCINETAAVATYVCEIYAVHIHYN